MRHKYTAAEEQAEEVARQGSLAMTLAETTGEKAARHEWQHKGRIISQDPESDDYYWSSYGVWDGTGQDASSFFGRAFIEDGVLYVSDWKVHDKCNVEDEKSFAAHRDSLPEWHATRYIVQNRNLVFESKTGRTLTVDETDMAEQIDAVLDRGPFLLQVGPERVYTAEH